MTVPRPPAVDLRSAAFGDRPDAAVSAIAADTSDHPRRRWLAAVTLGGQGRYSAAAGPLTELAHGPDPVFAALACSTLASHLRQIGGHAAARRWDAAALRRLHGPARPGAGPAGDPDGVDRSGALVDALLGLAADAVGLGRAREAGRLHAAALRAAGEHPSWRVTVRIDWVATEVALATGRASDAVSPAERAVDAACAVGAVRHTVKSIMMLGAALTAGGTPDGRMRAEALLTEALATSLKWGMFSLTWPCALVLADLSENSGTRYPEIASKALASVFDGSNAAMRRIAEASPWMPGRLIRSGDVTRTSAELTT